jgi:bifunctional DNA primase/polymerase-like protein/uncharacterized protein DUF3987
MGPYEQCAESLAERGYAPIPIMVGSKAPGFCCAGLWVPLAGWQKRYLHGRQPNYMDHNLWSNGDSGIGVVGGKASHGLVAVDIDTDDTAIKTAIVKVLPATPVKKVGAKGETGFYYGPDIAASRSWNINGKRVCDLIADGRQTVLPPTIHPDTGAPYRWVGNSLDLYDPDELPLLDADTIGDIGAVLIPFGWKPDPPPGKPGNGGFILDEDANSPHRALNNFALEHLERWVPKLGLCKCRPARGGFEAVAHWRESSTGRPLEARARNLGIVPKGIKDFGDGRGGGNGFTYTPLDLVMAANDCDLDTAFKFLSEHTGWAGERIELIDAPEPDPHPQSQLSPQPQSPTPEPQREDNEKAPVADELEPYTHDVPGVVGEVIEWIVATARRPNRVLALAAAIPLVGTLIGRRVAGPTRSATHLYAVAVAPTGAGKQHPIDCINALMIAAGAQEHIGPGSFMSASALCNFVYRKPLSLCCSDELGAYLAKLNAKGASGHERETTRFMRALWGISFALSSTPEWADRPAMQVHSPALSFFGTSTPDELFQALQGEAIDNGLLNRFLVLHSGLRARDTRPQLLPEQVPADLAAKCCQLYRWHGTAEELIDIKRSVEQQVTQLPWADQAAEKEYLDFTRMVDDRIDQDPALRPFLARAAETAIRLATIRAAGRRFRAATLTLEDVYWGAGIAWTAGQQLCLGAQSVIPVTERSKWVDRLFNYVRACSLTNKPATIRIFQQRVRGALKAKEIQEIVAEMVGLGLLQQDQDGTLTVVANTDEQT